MPRSEFQAEVRSRGGGFSQRLMLGPIAKLADTFGTDDFDVLTFVTQTDSATTLIDARNPKAPAQVDRYFFRGTHLQRSEPVRVAANDDLDAKSIGVRDLAFHRLDAMVDKALAEYKTDGGYVTQVFVGQVSGQSIKPGTFGFGVKLESPRSSATAIFDANGTFLTLERT